MYAIRSYYALHRREDPVGAGLHRQVDEFHQFGNLGMGLDECIGELQRVAGGIAQALDAVDGGDQMKQLGEVDQPPVVV